MAKPLLSKLKIAVQVGQSVFVHAGITEEQLASNDGILGMNREVREWITTAVGGGSSDERVQNICQAMPQFLQSFPTSMSPLWIRDYSSPPNKEPTARNVSVSLDSALALLGDVDRLIVGHTIQRGINSAMEEKVWRIDIGKGAEYGGSFMLKCWR